MNKWIFGILFVLCIGVAEAKLFDIDNTVMPTFMGCSITGCTMTGPIDMNGYAIYNASLVNPSLVEYDPIFTAENGTIWQAINSKLNLTDQRYNDTALIILVNDSIYLELGNYYTSTEVDDLLDNYYTQSEADNLFYPLTNPAGYINATDLDNLTNGTWVEVAGDTMTGDLNMSDHNITDVNTLFVHNITGRSPIFVSSPIISYENITAGTFYGNINGQNGTIYGVTITNGTITNLRVSDSAVFNTSLIPELNDTFTLGIPDKVWKSFYVTELYAANISSPDISNLYNITSQIIMDLAYKLNITDQRYNDTQFVLDQLLNYYNTTQIDFLFANYTYNETDPIFTFENASIWQAIDSKLNITDQRYNDTLLIESVNLSLQGQIDNITTNLSYIYIDIDDLYNITDALNASIKQPSGPYLANDSQYFWVNESALNYTINDIAKVRSLNYTITGLSGPGSVLSSINISYEITQIIVIPSSNTTNYRFTLTEYPSGDVIDENRAVHNGVWNIRKSYSLNSVVNASIVTSTPADTYTIIIKYLYNGVQ